MELKPGWLQRQFDAVEAEIAQWPDYMKREAGFMRDSQPTPADKLAEAVERLCSALNGMRACQTIQSTIEVEEAQEATEAALAAYLEGK